MIVTSTDLPHTNTAGILRDPVALVTGGTRGNGAGAGYPGQRYTVLEARRHDPAGQQGHEESRLSMREDVSADAEAAAAALAPEVAEFGSLDLAGLGESLVKVASRALSRPDDLAAAFGQFWLSLSKIGPSAAAHWQGQAADPPVPVPADRRFTDQAWAGNPFLFTLLQCYLAGGQLSAGVLAAGRGDPVADAKAQLAASFLIDALAPTNFLLTNPAALKRAFETGGASLLAGARNFVSDLISNRGMPRQVDTRPFELGVNVAATPGKVVFRNELMELIQYAPQTGKVRSVPLLASPPWINKYYVMDLAPGRSFLEWAVLHERTVFAISYRNPDASMRGVTLDDYLIHGPRQALDVIADITGAPKADIVGLCLGGALTGMLAAYLAGTGDDRLGSVTLLNTMLDYSRPGVLGAFTDQRTVARLERQMQSAGYLDGRQMATTFDMLRANDLIFSYVVSGWLMGQDPPAFDILAWNSRQHPDARRHALVLPAQPLHRERASPWRAEARRAAVVAGGCEERCLRARRSQRSHRAVARLLRGDQAARR